MSRRRALVPRRFRAALVVAWLASFASIALAIGPNRRGTYDPQLAVLTATLIGIIWYTYFSYRALHREQETILLADLRGHAGHSAVDLRPVLENRSPRTVIARIRVQVWVDGVEIPSRSYLDGRELVRLSPYQWMEEPLSVTSSQLNVVRLPNGEYTSGWTRLLVVMSAAWRDDLDDSSALDMQYWYADKGSALGLVPVVDSEGRAKFFGDVAAQVRPVHTV